MMRVVQSFGAMMMALSLSAGVAAAQTEPAQAVSIETAVVQPAGEIMLAQARRSAPRSGGTHVYLLRGWLDIFSTGMDDLGEKIRRRGVRASVHGHAEYLSLVDSISTRWKSGTRERVVIIGHSLGANAAVQMAAALGERGVPVPLVITYDPTTTVHVTRNVGRLVNYYSSTNGWGTTVGRAPGFRCNLSNVDLSRQGEMGHTDIDKSPRLHAQSISYILGGVEPAPSRAAKSKADGNATKSDAKPAASTSEERKSESASADGSKAAQGDAKSETGKEGTAASIGEAKAAEAETKASEPSRQETTASVGEAKAADAETKTNEPGRQETTASVGAAKAAAAESKKSEPKGDDTADKTAASPTSSTSSN